MQNHGWPSFTTTTGQMLQSGRLFGAIEIRHLAGPVFLDRDYHVQGEVVAVGESPKTEYAWYDTRAYDGTGTAVASMRMQLRWLKASSPLYAEGARE